MKRVSLTAALATLVALSMASGGRLTAQTGPESTDALRRQIERRFDVLPLRNGVALRPKGDDRRVRSIEVTDGSIALDGSPATGAELRDKLGADADLVMRLSYLDAAARQQLLGAAAAEAPEAERVDQPPAELPDRGNMGERDRRRRERRLRGYDNGNDRVRFGGSVTVGEGEVVDGDVVAIGGSTTVNGEVTGNAVAIGGGLELGPKANVLGDAVSIGGAFKRDPGARIGGKVVDVGGAPFDFGDWRWGGFRRMTPFGWPFFGAAAGMFALMGTLMRVFVLCVLSCIVVFVGRDYVERVGARAAAEPLKAGAIGLLAQLLFVPLLVLTIVVFVITIIGIPLLVLIPFAMLALAVMFLVGFTAIAFNLGRLVNARFAWSNDNPYVTALTGIVLLVSPVLVARLLGLANWFLFPITGSLVFLGLLVEYLAWTVGLGAVALLRFSRSPAAPPATV